MNNYLGIELGSTRIKAVAVDEEYRSVSAGSFTWAPQITDGIWSYDLDTAIKGIKSALSQIKNRESIKAAGVSAMMHGYLAFDKDWNLLTPFRSWQNTVTADESARLTEVFGFNIPQRWSIAHLYRAVVKREEHLPRIAHITTLAGYVHYMLTGVNAVGIGEASGIFPVDGKNGYDKRMLKEFAALTKDYRLPWKLEDILPGILTAGEYAGRLTESGSRLLDGLLPAGLLFAPPEGDAGTGMAATNSLLPGTGNVSAGTSVFLMAVLKEPLKKARRGIDVVATPTGNPVAMVHCNNCTADFNAWAAMLGEAAALFGNAPAPDTLYEKLFTKSLEGAPDCGGIVVCNYTDGEEITGFERGVPLVARLPGSSLSLADFLRASLYSALAALKIGLDILTEENVKIERLTGHGGFFKTPGVGQKYMAAACETPVACMETTGEGGPYGMALLAAYAHAKADGETLEDFLEKNVFAKVKTDTVYPFVEDVRGFREYTKKYKLLLSAERCAADIFKERW